METQAVRPRIALSLPGGHLFVLSDKQANELVERDPVVAREYQKWRAMGGGRGRVILIQPDTVARILGDLGLRPSNEWWQDGQPAQPAEVPGVELAVEVAIPLPRGGFFHPNEAVTVVLVTSDAAMTDANDRVRESGEHAILQVHERQRAELLGRIGLRSVEEWYA